MSKLPQPRAAVLAGLLLAALGAPAAGQGLDERSDYAACMALAQAEPRAAFDEARAWAGRGGGEAARHCAAVSLFGLGRHAEAARRLESLSDGMTPGATGPRARVLAQAGQAWLLAGEGTRAARALTRALGLAPDNVELMIDRSIALATTGGYWEAVDDLNRAHDLAPARADILVLRASAYRSLEAMDLAGDDLARALALDPGNPDGLLERGILRRLTGDPAGARADWTRIVETAPGSFAAQAARNNLDNLDKSTE